MARPLAARGQTPKLTEKKSSSNLRAVAAAQAPVSSSYKSDGVVDNDVFLLPVSDYQIMIGLTLLAAIVRVFRIYQPTSVVFDEVHFGGFASKYIKGKFFMDVHPPLAKMLIALTGWLAGFDGRFDFKEIGKDYLEPNVPYVAMRMFPAICGVFLAPAIFLTLKAYGCRTSTAALGSGLVIFENGLLTQARLILLDSPLMAATALTALAFVSFTNQHELGPEKAFQLSWWFWLFMTGLGLGITVSIKWVGLFTIAWVGSISVIQLWILLGDNKNVTVRLWFKHLMARFFCLAVIPGTFYLAMFAIHFMCLRNPGDGDGFMSSEFQATLNNKGMKDVAADVIMGSRVTLRHVNTQGGYLHSHPLMYPTGSKQQQITLYPHKDENNIWLLENQTQPIDHGTGVQINGSRAWDSLPERHFVKNGDVLRLYHLPTHRRLHSHDVRPPITEADWQYEVSAYGYEGFEGDANDMFRVEIVKSKSTGAVAKERLRTIQTKFRLIHVMTGCALFSHKVKLPEWASEQQEVTCARGGTVPNSLWYIEGNDHPLLDEGAEKVNYANPGFLGKFWELQKVMWKTNAGLVDSHAWDSRPSSWPVLKRGINFWGKDHRQIYLLGNPLVWWSSTAAVALYVVFKGLAVLRWQRSCGDYQNTTFKRFDYEIGTLVLGWAFHYFPFYLMKRQLFLHHYFPALYFGILAFCQVIDFGTARIASLGVREKPIINRVTAVVFLATSAAIFSLFAPIAYGNMWTKAECKRVKLFSSWDFDCNAFYENYDQYSLLPSTASKGAVATPGKSIPAKAGAPKPGMPAKEEEDARPVEPNVSGAPVLAGQHVLSREEKVEYRDQDGNLLSPEQVKELEGKVEFHTKYETRTRLLNADGAEIEVPVGDSDGEQVLFAAADDDVKRQQKQQQHRQAEGAEQDESIAPPHPDVEGADPKTDRNDNSAAPPPPENHVLSEDGDAKGDDESAAKPEGEVYEATPKHAEV